MDHEAPSVRPTQFEGDQIGHLARSVNLSRGDVNFTKTLVQLSGKPNDSTLAVTLSLQLQSNVRQKASLWNLDTPTGICGLGWSLGVNRVEASSNGSLAPAALTFALDINGSKNPLVQDGAAWLRLTLDASTAATLQAGQVSSAVVAAFAAQGLALGANAQVTAQGSDWIVSDPQFERVFTIVPTSSGADVYDGGASFQLQSYQFWKVVYYAPYERWEITTDSGEISSYGGGVGSTAQRFAVSAGNSIQWGVRWGGLTGNWTGPSASTAGQSQYAKAWNLAYRYDRWGDRVAYGYNEFPRGSDGLLGRNAEQAVGQGGLPYTKAIYLTSVVDVFGRTITLVYGDKSYTAAVQEYQDPHKALQPASALDTPPANLGAPNAYQDCYGTLFLDHLVVTNEDGTALYSIELSYDTPQPVSTMTGNLTVMAAKRYLSSVTEVNAYGQSLPGFLFDYYLDAADGPNLGAVKSITYPQGAVATWTYATSTLDICERTITVSPPGAAGTGASPSVWYGENFVVSTWVDFSTSLITLDVYTWVGRWMHWSAGTLYTSPGGVTLQPNTLQVQANGESFAICFADSQGTNRIFLVGRNPNMPTEWTVPPNPVTIANATVLLSGGSAFIVAVAQLVLGGSELYCFTWNWRTLAWDGVSTPPTQYANAISVRAGEEYFLVATSNNETTSVSLNWLDADGNWHVGNGGQPLTLDYFPGANTNGVIVWGSGPSLAAMTFADPSNQYLFSAALIRWDTDYNLSVATFDSLTLLANDAAPRLPSWPPEPVVVDTSLVAVRQNLFRYDAGTWNTEQIELGASGAKWIAFAYGSDVAIGVVNNADDAATVLQAYDADTGAFAAAAAISTELPKADVESLGWPSVAKGNFIVARNALFYRACGASWAQSVSSAVQTLPASVDVSGTAQTVNSRSLINGSPNFLAYLSQSPVAPDAVQLMLLQNGGVPDPPPMLTSTSYNVPFNRQPATLSGQEASAGATLVTWPANASGFSAASAISLRRFAGQSMSGPITCYPVATLSVTDGFGGSYGFSYEFSGISATCMPSGEVVKYYQAATYAGTTKATASKFGRTVYSYQNGYAPGSSYSMLDGLLTQTVQFSGAIAFATQWQAALKGEMPTAPNGEPQTISPLGALAQLFTTAGTPLSANAKIVLCQIDGHYRFWLIGVVAGTPLYNIDYTGDPQDPSGLRIFEGGPVMSLTSDWTVFTSRNSNPFTADATPARLHGGYARVGRTISRKDGVPLVTNYTYAPAAFANAPFYGGTFQRSWSFDNANGMGEQHTQETTYGFAVDAGTFAFPASLLAANLLSPVAQVRALVSQGQSQSGGGQTPGPNVTSSAAATTWTGWPQQGGNKLTVLAPSQQWIWVGDPSGTDSGNFPSTPAPGSLWRLASTVNQVGDSGLVTQSTDPGGTVHSSLYDAAGRVQIAMFSNVSVSAGQGAFTSFESYEDLAAWTLSGKAAFISSNGNSGASSLLLPSAANGGGSASLAALNPDPGRVLVVSFWVNAAAGYVSGAGSGVTLTVAASGKAVGTPIVAAFAATNGQWSFVSTPVNLPALVPGGTSEVTVTLTAANSGSSDVLIDDLSVVPLTAEFVGKVYDPVYRLSLSRVGLGGKLSRKVRNASMAPVGGTNPAGAAVGLKLTYYSRLGNPGGFSARDPNASLALKAAGGGTSQTFRNGTAWTADWTPSAASAFAASNGILSHANASTSATLTAVNAPPTGAMALYFGVVPLGPPPLTLTDDFTVAIGSAASFTLSVGGQWSGQVAGQPVAPLSSSFSGPLAWVLLMQIGGFITLHANGKLMFSVPGTAAGAPAITTGQNALGLMSLMLLSDPAVTMRFNDGTGAAVQDHALTAEDYLVNQIIRDPRGKVIVNTKTAPALFGSGAALPVPSFRPGFVDVKAFLEGIDGAALMSGDVNDWYDGTHGTNDQGYPYNRTALEPSPLARPIEAGLPGQAQAIVNYATTTPAERQTIQCVYGSNASAPVPGLSLPTGSGGETGCYQAHTVVSPAKVATTTILDAAGAVVARATPVSGAGTLSATAADFGNGALSIWASQPNSYVPDAVPFRGTEVKNGLQQMVQASTPDTGTIDLIYDIGGRVRFVQDAAALAAGSATYVTWDAIGRPLSRGTFAVTGSIQGNKQLQQNADDPSWPEDQTAVPYICQRRQSWDGDGSKPEQIGKCTGTFAQTGTASDAITVTQSQAWSPGGLLASRTTAIADPTGTLETFATGFGYDALARPTSITYPSADGLTFSEVSYRYSGMDQILAIADENDVAFATYSYDAMGNAVGTTFGNGSSGVTRTFDSTGRVLDVVAKSSAVDFNSGITFATDGAVATLTETLTPDVANFAATVTYGYDGLMRFLSASDANNTRTLGVSFEAPSGTVDRNGNIQTLTDSAGVSALLAYDQGTNRVGSVTPQGDAASPYTYLANGALETRGSGSDALTFTYVPGGTLPLTATTNGTTIAFAYDNYGGRWLSRISGQAPQYSVFGGTAAPVMTVTPDGTATAWIYGPTGLVAMASGGARNFIATDYLASPRLVLDAAGNLVAAYAYNALGRCVAKQEPAANYLPFQFTGQQFIPQLDLYDFKARLYDPAIGRFLVPDPKHQFPSSYCYAGNLPTMLSDPSGQMSSYGEAAIDLALVTILAGAMVASAGCAGPVVGAAAALGTEAGIVLFGTSEAALGAASALGSFSGVAAGATLGAATGAASGLAEDGLEYDALTPPGQWNGTQFWNQIALGAVSGAIGGAITGGLTAMGPAMDGASDRAVRKATGEAAGLAEPASEPASNPAENPGPDPAEAPAQQASQKKQGSTGQASFLTKLWISTGAGAVGSAVQDYVSNGITNLHQGKSFNDHALAYLFLGMATGTASGAFSATLSGLDEQFGLTGKAWSTLKSQFAADPVRLIATGTLLGGGGVMSLYMGRVDWLDALGNNQT